MKLKISKLIKKDIRRLEIYLSEFSGKLDGILGEAVESILTTGGKRIRPALFFICAKNEKYDLEYLLPAAASIEIIHTASLIHDDIIDNSSLRRGGKTIHNIYNKDVAKFVGNYLFTHTFSLLNYYKNSEILEEMSNAAQNLVKGEFDQIKTKWGLDQDEDIYFKKINKKTSSLFEVSCVLGAILSNSKQEDIKNLRKFGKYFGISYQINDDISDINIRKTLKINGKPICNDIRQGNITLPLIYALKNEKFKNEFKSILNKKVIIDRDLKKILFMISKNGAVKLAQEKFCITYIKQKK